MFMSSWLQGLPFPSNEFNAVDVVVRYSVSELGFAFEDIILLAWSIGKAEISLIYHLHKLVPCSLHVLLHVLHILSNQRK